MGLPLYCLAAVCLLLADQAVQLSEMFFFLPSFAWKRKSISLMTSAVTVLLMSFFNISLLSVTTSARTSPIRERTCSS